jgi:hypothetical protein
LNNVLNFTSGGDDDHGPITAEMIKNITQILADGDPAAGTYDVDDVLTAIVYATRALELEISTLNDKYSTVLRLLGQ